MICRIFDYLYFGYIDGIARTCNRYDPFVYLHYRGGGADSMAFVTVKP